MKRLMILGASLALLTACDATTPVEPGSPLGDSPPVEHTGTPVPSTPSSPSDPSAQPEPATPIPGHFGDPRPTVLVPEPAGSAPGHLGGPVAVDLVPAPALPSRERRRMDIDQLDAALKAATGTTWTQGPNEVNQLEALARTLGKPDYYDLTQEDLEPGALFNKFLDDAARSVCQKAVTADLAKAPEERVILRTVGPNDTLETHPDEVEANLQALLLRFHGRAHEAGAPGLQAWRWLFQSASHVSDPVLAWRTVCVGLVVHPDFYTY